MKIVFTIITRNYLPMALCCMDSFTNHNKDTTAVIVIADKHHETKELDSRYDIVYASDVLSIDYSHYAMKYNVTEFCTYLKPLMFLKLSEMYKSDRLVYIDPDIYTFGSFEEIYEQLETYSCVVTPHWLDYEGVRKKLVPEQVVMFSGVFNFGFVGFNTEKGVKALRWWSEMLEFACYHDKVDSFHTDQKIGDFFPVILGNQLKILKSPGMNVAIWNLHEREVHSSDGRAQVVTAIGEYSDLIFVHFAGYHHDNESTLHKGYPWVDIDDFKGYKALIIAYREHMKSRGWPLLGRDYKYNFFDNGKVISHFQRRLYRSLVEFRAEDELRINCFSDKGEFYRLLKAKRLLLEHNPDGLREYSLKDFDKNLRLMQSIFHLIKVVLGPSKYSLLLKFLHRFSRPENQIFLLDKKYRGFFINENRDCQ